jgi:hypothetical protein
MHINVGDIFKAVGPAASIIFAAWIFVSFLQVRYDSAVERYLDMIKQYRGNEVSASRRDLLKEEILTYRRRCALMNMASVAGLTSAIILVLSLVSGVVVLVFPALTAVGTLCILLAVLGFLTIIFATAIVMVEGSIIHTQLERQLLDLPEIAEQGRADNSEKPKRKRLGIVR